MNKLQQIIWAIATISVTLLVIALIALMSFKIVDATAEMLTITGATVIFMCAMILVSFEKNDKPHLPTQEKVYMDEFGRPLGFDEESE